MNGRTGHGSARGTVSTKRHGRWRAVACVPVLLAAVACGGPATNGAHGTACSDRCGAAATPQVDGSPLTWAVTVTATRSAMVSGQRVERVADRRALAAPGGSDVRAVFGRLGAVDAGGEDYRLTLTNTSHAPVDVTSIGVVVRQRSAPLAGSYFAELPHPDDGPTPRLSIDLDEHAPRLTDNNGRAFPGGRPVRIPAAGHTVLSVEASIQQSYVDYALRVDYVDASDQNRSVTVEDPVFRLSSPLPATRYADYWGTNSAGTSWALCDAAAKKTMGYGQSGPC
jgi:hypothetical protein